MSTESTHTVVDNESITEEQSGPVFTLFPKLPPELRNKIWKNACFVTRFIDLWYFPVGEKEFRDACIKESSKRLLVYKSHSQTPPVSRPPPPLVFGSLIFARLRIFCSSSETICIE
jgi:hypothetical protein